MAYSPRRDDRDLFYWLALRLAPGVGAVRFAQLLELFKTPESVFAASGRELSRLPRLPQKTVAALSRFDWADEVEKEIQKACGLGYRLITLIDEAYPARLKEIKNPPPVLWVNGDILTQDKAAVAVVGSRSASQYGLDTSARLAKEMAEAGVTIVSGVALGIDAAAHWGALEAGGRTIGVLGCGLDVVYPRNNRDLYQEIPGSGALVSEFRLGTAPEPGHFPSRNRIISGLSLAVVVVEASQRSGALITAQLALEQNREVLAVPGQIGSARSKGTHGLLKQGAMLVENGWEIVNEILPQLDKREVGLIQSPDMIKSSKAKPKSSSPTFNLTEEEAAVWTAIGDEAIHIDVLGRNLYRTPPELAPLLLEMELKGLIRQLPGMRYKKVV